MKGSRLPLALLAIGRIRCSSCCSFLVASYNLTARHGPSEIYLANWWQRWRGPDATNVVGLGGWTFLHNLLSMTGAFTLQPFVSNDGSIAAVFNGEIYNYRELAAELTGSEHSFASDGYALLPAYRRWGEHFATRLHGEFALVLVDFSLQRIILTTDVFSTKPLWWASWQDGGSGGEYRFLAASYESALQHLGAPDGKRWMADANQALVINFPRAAGPAGAAANDGFRVVTRYPLVRWDLRQHKNTTADWEAALRLAVAVRTRGVKHKAFIGLSSGYDSGAIMLSLFLQRTPFLAYAIRGREDLRVVEERARFCSQSARVVHVEASRVEFDAQRAWLRAHCEPYTYSFEARRGERVWDDEAATGMSIVLRRVRRAGGLIYLSGSGSDEIISDYARDGRPIYPHSCFRGVFPRDLAAGGFFPWCSFYGGSQRAFLMKEELTSGAHGIEGRYPFLDPNVVQEFLWLSATVKNSEYKRPVADFLRRHTFPNAWGAKYGFKAADNLRASPANEAEAQAADALAAAAVAGTAQVEDASRRAWATLRDAGRTLNSLSTTAPRRGFCAQTVDGDNGDCDAGHLGSWLAVPSGVTTISDCAALCDGCPRCNYVSFSAEANDCSWFHECNLNALRTDFGSTHRSMAVVHEAESPSVGRGVDRAAAGKSGGGHRRARRRRRKLWSRSHPARTVTRNVPGMCGTTWREGECDSEASYASGAWPTSAHAIASLGDCEAACRACARCAYVSYSRALRDCSWFSRCELDDLRRPPPEGVDYVTSMVRPATQALPSYSLGHAPAEAARRPRIALTTVCVGAGVRCALVQWCQGATRLREALPLEWRIELLVISSDAPSDEQHGHTYSPKPAGRELRQSRRSRARHPSPVGRSRDGGSADDGSQTMAQCPAAKQLHVTQELHAALDGCSTRWKQERAAMLAAARGHSDAGARRRRTGESHMRRNLFKWAVFGLDSYDLVLLADVDIDLMPAEQSPRAISKQWRELLPAFIRQPETARSSGSRGWGTDGSLPSAIDAPLFVGNADVSSPINNGLFLARPSRDLYQDGIRILRRCVFNVTTGWERVGRPTTLGVMPRHLDGSLVGDGPKADVGGYEPLATKAYEADRWDFVGASSGQGFFFYMLFIRHRVGRYARFSGAHRPMHWWGGEDKPWQPPKEGLRDAPVAKLLVRRDYLSRTRLMDGGSLNATDCVRGLWEMQRAIEESPRFQATFRPGVGIRSDNPIFPLW